jgi:NADPH:quinone reductase-like Zn-dependent oxidoreductase
VGARGRSLDLGSPHVDDSVAAGRPEVPRLDDVAEPRAGPGQVRVRVTAAGLNPMDWAIISNEDLAARFAISPPTGFGYDFAGVVDEAGEGAEGFTAGDRVFGGAMSRAVADHVVVTLSGDQLLHTPDAVDDVTASSLPAAATASAALAAATVRDGDTVLIGGAAGGGE